MVSATFTITSPSGLDPDVVHHAEIDDRGAELGIEDAREHAADVVGGGGDGVGHGRSLRSVGGVITE